VDATLAELAALGDRVRAAKGVSGNATALGAVVAEMTSLKSAAASAVELCLRHNLRQILAAQPPTAAPATPPESLSTHPKLQSLLYALPTQRKRQVEKELRAAHKQLLQSQQPPQQQPPQQQKKNSNKGAAPETARAICKACDRPARTCICPFLPKPRVPNELHVIVLMHPKELERKITTVKLAALSLAKCDVLVGRELDPFLRPGACPALAEALGEGHEGTGRTCVLFPGEGAFDMSAVAPPSAAGDSREATPRPRPLPRARFLLVFDGTWRFAREMFVKNRHHLQGVTQVQFSRPFGMGAAGLSEFVTRVEPAEMCASTLEAIVAALCTLEPSLESFRGRHGTCERRCPIALTMHALTLILLDRAPPLVCWHAADLLRPLRQMMRFQLGKGALAGAFSGDRPAGDTGVFGDTTPALDAPVSDSALGAQHVKASVPHRQRPWAVLRPKA
jgi:DTW domain-containing protein YfiP